MGAIGRPFYGRRKMERKNYLGLGIVLAIFAALISLMCIAFSYADVNELNATENAEGEQIEAVVGGEEQGEAVVEDEEQELEDNVNETNSQYEITLQINKPSGAVLDVFYKDSPVVGNKITTGDCDSYTLKKGGTFTVVEIIENNTTDRENTSNILRIENLSKGYETAGWSFVEDTYTTDITIKLDIKAVTTFNIKGVVKDDADSSPIANAYVHYKYSPANVFITTKTNSNGEYLISDLPISALPLTSTDDNHCELFAIADGYEFSLYYLDFGDFTEFTNIIERDRYLEVAYLTVKGSEHHVGFNVVEIEDTPYGVNKDSFYCPYFAIGESYKEYLEGLDFTIANDGTLNGSVEQPFNASIKIDFMLQPICEEGYIFDNIEYQGQKYVAGQTLTVNSNPDQNFLVNYKEVSTEIAKTGDAIPFVAIVGLGMIAVVAFVVARKQYNK